MHDAPDVGAKGTSSQTKAEHTEEVLRDLLGLSDEEIDALESDGVVHRG